MHLTSAPARTTCESTLWKTSELVKRSLRRLCFPVAAVHNATFCPRWAFGFWCLCSSASFLTVLFFTAVMVLAALSEDSCLFAAGRWSSLSTISFSNTLCLESTVLWEASAQTNTLAGAMSPPLEGFGFPWVWLSLCTTAPITATGLRLLTIEFSRALTCTHPLWVTSSCWERRAAQEKENFSIATLADIILEAWHPNQREGRYNSKDSSYFL